MKPLSLHLENVRTFDHLDFDFPAGCSAVTGPNGSGKSTLVSALDVALFGAEGRSLADWLTKDRQEATLMILLVFEHEGETYRVRRSFSGKGRGTSKVDLERQWSTSTENGHGLTASTAHAEEWEPLTRESAAATQEEIERIIGLTRETFRASAFLAQGQGGMFCEATPGKRKEILAAVLGLDVWDGYRERARAELRVAEQSLAVARARIESAETELAERPGLALLLAQAQENEQAARAALDESSSQLSKARERLSKLREAAGLRHAAERAAAAAERAHAGLVERVEALERQIEAAADRLAERPGLDIATAGLSEFVAERAALERQTQGWEQRELLRVQRTRLFDEAADLVARAEGLAAKALAAAENPTTEVCPACDRVLDDASARAVVASYKAQADELGTEATAKAREADDLIAQMRDLPDEAPDSGRITALARLIEGAQGAQVKLAALAEVEAARDRAAKELDEVRAELPEREKACGDARAELLALGPHDPQAEPHAVRAVHLLEAQGASARERADFHAREIARLEERLKRLETLANQTEQARAERGHLQSEAELLSHLERACGPNGIPALILETSAIPQLEAEWNRLLRLLPTDSGDLFEVELHTQRERKSGDGAVDALDVVVYANGHARPFSTYSGGEQMRISIAQRRALSNLLAHRRGADCPLMILDEPNSLDDAGMAALARVLEDLATAEDLTILVVSHDPALRDAFEQSIEITKQDGRSRIVGAAVPSPIMEVAHG